MSLKVARSPVTNHGGMCSSFSRIVATCKQGTKAIDKAVRMSVSGIYNNDNRETFIDHTMKKLKFVALVGAGVSAAFDFSGAYALGAGLLLALHAKAEFASQLKKCENLNLQIKKIQEKAISEAGEFKEDSLKEKQVNRQIKEKTEPFLDEKRHVVDILARPDKNFCDLKDQEEPSYENHFIATFFAGTLAFAFGGMGGILGAALIASVSPVATVTAPIVQAAGFVIDKSYEVLSPLVAEKAKQACMVGQILIGNISPM